MTVDRPSFPGIIFFGEWRAGKKLHKLPRHKNPGLEFVLVSKGELSWEVEGKQEKVKPGMLFYTLPWQEHGGVEEIQPSSEISYFCIALDAAYDIPRGRFGFHKSFAFLPTEERAISRALSSSRRHALPASREFVWLMAHFFKAMRGTGPLRAARVRDTVKLLIADVAFRATEGHSLEPPLLEAERRVKRFAASLAGRYAEPWTLESMSRSCGLGRTQFALLMKRYMGETPVTYLNRIRVREARRLLRGTPKSITEIAFDTGFNTSQYFATVFKEFTGMSGAAFRKGGD